MSVIDLREIPKAHVASGKQDAFEFFAADFLEALGYTVVDRPARGADLGKDLIAVEKRTGVGGETTIRWLVSCKHTVHSGEAVGVDDEQNILERVAGHKCQGFISFYSTLPSSALQNRLKQLEDKFEVQVFDQARIEKLLLSSPNFLLLAKRFVPSSLHKWISQNPRRAKVFTENETLSCEYCGRDLFAPPSGIFVVWRKVDTDPEKGRQLVDFHYCCKGHCDRVLSAQIAARHDYKIIGGWDDIPDLCIPVIFLQKVMAILNGLVNGNEWSPSAFDKLKSMLLVAYQHVAREASPDEQERIRKLMAIPAWLGGLGYENED